MKIFHISPLLWLLLSAVPALSQPNDAPQPFQPVPPPPRRPRPAEPGKQITQDLLDFAKAINGDNAFPAAQQWIYGARVGYFGANEWVRQMATQRRGVSIKVGNIAVDKIEGDSATVTVTYSFTAPNANDWGQEAKAFLDRDRNETLQLKLGVNPTFGEEKVWQIVPPEQPQAFNEPEANNIWTTLSYYLAQKQPIDVAAVKARKSMANLKQLALGVMQFLQDWDERYAFAPEYAQEALMPYVKSQDIFLVPGTRETYSFNANLSDKPLADVNEAAKTVLLYEGENEKPVFRYDGKAAIGFADGHIALVTPDEAKNLIWRP